MIQLLEQPFTHSFVRNPVVYRWRAVDANGLPYRSYGVQSEILVTDTDAFTGDYVLQEGDTIRLNWTEPDGTTGTQLFSARDAYNGPSELPTANSGIATISAVFYWQLIVEIMGDHPVASSLFRFSATTVGTDVSFVGEVLEVSDDWTFTFVVTVASVPHTVTDTTTTTPSTLPENHRIVYELFFESTYRDEGFERIGRGEIFINSESELSLDVARMLRAAVEDNLGDPYVPAYATTEPVLADNTRRYYLRYREEYDDIVSPEWSYDSVRLTINGGISQALYAQVGDWLAGRSADTSLLTWKPDRKRLAVTTKEYLAWYNYTGFTTEVVMEYVGTNTDGTNTAALYQYTTSPAEARANETILFPVGMTELGQAADTDIAYYTVRIVDASSDYAGGSPTYLSPARTYEVDRKQYESVRYLQYLNGFGCPETLRCLGYFSNDLQVERETAARTLSPGYSATTQQVKQHNESFDNFFTYRTGHLPRLELDSLQELFIRGHAYEIFAEGYIPLQLVDSQMPVGETRRVLHNMTLSARPALLAGNYSNVLSEQVAQGDLWLLADNSGYWLTVFGQRWELV